MTYEYVNPLDKGYRKLFLTRKQHNDLFPMKPIKWYWRYEYYISDGSFLLNRFTSNLGILVNIISSPLMIVLYGWNNLKGDFKKLLNEKKYGSFSSDKVGSSSTIYKKLIEIEKLSHNQ